MEETLNNISVGSLFYLKGEVYKKISDGRICTAILIDNSDKYDILIKGNTLVEIVH